MKRLLLFLSLCFICTAAIAHTINWYVDGSVYHTTTCENGEDVTPPTAPEKYGYTFHGWVSYTPIEYLESTGTQWIDTGVIYNDNMNIKLRFIVENLKENMVLFGYRFVDEATTIGNMRFVFLYKDGRLGLRLGTEDVNTMNSSPAINANVVYEIQLKNKKLYVNNQLVAYEKEVFHTNDFGVIHLLHINADYYYDKDINNIFYGKIYYFQIYDNDVLIRDFIPVLDKDGIPCIYDLVEHKFYYNAGTGDFIAGPIVDK